MDGSAIRVEIINKKPYQSIKHLLHDETKLHIILKDTCMHLQYVTGPVTIGHVDTNYTMSHNKTHLSIIVQLSL